MMSQKEQLSALLDNESSDEVQAQLVKSLHDYENQGFYLRQNIVKDVLHGENYTPLPANFMADLSKKLDKEPVIFAPSNIKSKVQNWKQKAVGFAVAASVGMVSLLLMQNNNSNEGVLNNNLAQISPQAGNSNLLPTSTSSLPLTARVPGYQLASDEQVHHINQWQGMSSQMNPEYQELLNQYLATHTEISSVGQLQGIMPYSKIVGFDTQK